MNDTVSWNPRVFFITLAVFFVVIFGGAGLKCWQDPASCQQPAGQSIQMEGQGGVPALQAEVVVEVEASATPEPMLLPSATISLPPTQVAPAVNARPLPEFFDTSFGGAVMGLVVVIVFLGAFDHFALDGQLLSILPKVIGGLVIGLFEVVLLAAPLFFNMLTFIFRLGVSTVFVLFYIGTLAFLWNKIGTFGGVLNFIWGVKEQ